MWFVFALLSTLGWGFADLFYKASSDEDDRYSHLKIAVWVGLVMGVCALILLPFAETPFDFSAPGASLKALTVNAVRYSPASLCYILSMVIGYAGLRYLELSIASPVQNASGALSAVVMLIYFVAVGRIESVREEFSVLELIGTLVIVLGVIALAIAEQRLSRDEAASSDDPETRKYRLGALALLFPILYCVFDTLGTAADGILLDGETGLGLGEIDILVLYGLTFFLAGIGCWVFLWIKQKKPYNPFGRGSSRFGEGKKAIAAVFEEIGQIFYVYAMAMNPVVAAPMVASYCAVSLLLSRVFLKEKIKSSQLICVLAIIAGILLLGISEGLAER